MCAFYRLWIQNFSSKTEPLYRLTKKDTDFNWGKEQNESFILLKKELTNPPILRAINYEKNAGKIILTIDASPYGAGAVLQQEDIDGNRYVCRYESKSFSERERRYPQIKRELLALKLMVKKLKLYLYGTHFTIETDAKSLLYMLNKIDLPNDTAARWISYLQLFDFEIGHIKGSHNVVADALSRDPQFENKIKEYIVENKSVFVRLDKDEKLYFIFEVLSGMKSISSNKNLKLQNKELSNYFVKNKMLFRRSKPDRVPRRFAFYKKEQEKILMEVHSGIGGGHRGRDGTMRKAKDRYYWRNMFKDVDKLQLDSKNKVEMDAVKGIIDSRNKDKERFDSKKKIRRKRLEIGDLVLVFDDTIGKQRQLKLSNKRKGPFKIYSDNNNGSYVLSDPSGNIIKGSYAGNRVKRYFCESQPVGFNSVEEDVVVKYDYKEDNPQSNRIKRR
ncbi:Retrovirus-related Pol polyprotein from transposon [Smittium culicis]|uniref:Retrovirus-related Pol polyprotein from transposon n=2 Tax=Smittium culicis TaxID=133412 RepID=A0A1R1Y308_9FUNG|nr:Retrovirus-related Pol polyprotein from transposon [Smittium culicis]